MAEVVDADSLLLLCTTKSITVSELGGLFSLCSSTSNSDFSLDFCVEKKASMFVVFSASENLSFLLSLRQLWGCFSKKIKTLQQILQAGRRCWLLCFRERESAA